MPQPDFSNHFQKSRPKQQASVGDKWIRAGCITILVIIGLPIVAFVLLWLIGFIAKTVSTN